MDEDKVLVPDGFFPRHVDIPPSSADAGTSLAVVPPIQSIESIKLELSKLASKLLTVTDVQETKTLNIEIQRHRVVLILAQEVGGMDTSGDYGKEMALLNRMLQGEDTPDGMVQDDAEKAAQMARAEQALADRGVDPNQAARILSVLEAIVSRVDHGSGNTPHRQPPAS